jgi:hypothetical protein
MIIADSKMKSVLASVFSILRGSPLGNLGANDQ